jgi:hypothetical protein
MKEPVYDLIPVLAVNEGPDYEKKNACSLENRKSYNDIIAILADCPCRFNRILSADDRVAFPICFPARPIAK